MFTKRTTFFLTREAYSPQNMKYCAFYQLRPDSLLYLSHNSCQMVFLFVRFVSANRLRRTDVALVKKKLVTLSGCKLSVAGLHIIKKKNKKNPSPPYSHSTSGLNLRTKNRRAQPDKNLWNPDISKQLERKPVRLKSSTLSFVEC